MAKLAKALNDLRDERDRISRQLERLDEAITVLASLDRRGSDRRRGPKAVSRKRRLSVAARKRIAQAQKLRWAKWKARQQKKAA